MAAKPTSLCFLQDAHILREAQLQLADAEKDEGFPYVVTRVPKTSAAKVGTCSTQGKGGLKTLTFGIFKLGPKIVRKKAPNCKKL